jgi:hypothetical protein
MGKVYSVLLCVVQYIRSILVEFRLDLFTRCIALGKFSIKFPVEYVYVTLPGILTLNSMYYPGIRVVTIYPHCNGDLSGKLSKRPGKL